MKPVQLIIWCTLIVGQVHHHHIHKLIWITSGLFLAYSLVCSGWYNTGNKLDDYVANDTKYRYLRLDTAQKGLQLHLDHVDSLYNTQSDMRKTVLETQEEYLQNFERLSKAERLKAEAKDLEKEAQRKWNHKSRVLTWINSRI